MRAFGLKTDLILNDNEHFQYFNAKFGDFQVLDVNDNPPHFNSSRYSAGISTNDEPDSVILTAAVRLGTTNHRETSLFDFAGVRFGYKRRSHIRNGFQHANS